MTKKYRTKRASSRERSPERKGPRVISADGQSVQMLLPLAEVLTGAKDALEGLVGQIGILVVQTLLEDEVTQRVGPRSRKVTDRSAYRHGHEAGYIVFAGRKVPIERPRMRGTEGGELPLERYELFQNPEHMQEAVGRRVLKRVSTRNYEGVLDTVCEGYGVRKSSVSRQFKALSLRRLTELLERSLDEIDLVGLMIDGIQFQGSTLVVALGFAADGKKHVLGIWEGASENAEVCKDLLASLVDRGLRTDTPILCVLDGAKALKKAVKAVFGKRAIVQRCMVHKTRNVISYLPKQHHAPVAQRLRAAWGMANHDDAKKALLQVVRYLDGISHSAASSLREGLDETLVRDLTY